MQKIYYLIVLLTCIYALSGCSSTNLLQEKLNDNKSPYNNNLFSQETEEIKTPVRLRVLGKVPVWISGTFVRNGPGKFRIGQQGLSHWFDGFAFLAGFEFDNGQINYKSSFVQSDQLKDSVSANKLMLQGFADNYEENKPKHSSHDGQKVKTANPNINLEKIGDHFVALGETPLPVEFDLRTLDTIGIFDYKDRLKKENIWESAHTKTDPETGSIYNFYIEYGLNSYYVLYRIEKGQSTRKVITKYLIDKPSYIHDFSITKQYVIIVAYPLVVSPFDLMNSRNSFIGSHKWQPELKTKIYVFDKLSGRLTASLTTDAMFAYHHINAYETYDNKIELFLSTGDDSKSIINIGYDQYIAKDVNFNLRKIEIDLKAGAVYQNILSHDIYEMPRVPDDLVGKQTRFFYSILFTPRLHKKGFALAKYDLKYKKPLLWSEDDCFPGEPIFVKKPNALHEDDGVLLSIIYDHKHIKSFLLILDAKTMKEIARAYAPQLIPFGFHGKLFN